ncbi:MAG: glycosyltransferase family 39 protein [Elusimicrobia bacterium]|nr:glycosyltransferase family 39 protein [Elusimicrobiota bacterium]
MPGKSDYIAPVLFLAIALSLSPWAYNFPLNDDWAYAAGVKHFIEQGRFMLCDWASATQLLHILSGVLCAKIFGFSFAALRVQTILFAAAGVFVFSKLLDEFDIGPFEKLAAALALSLNPVYLVSANSFMTDTPYFFFMLLAVYFGALYLKTGRERHLLWLAFFSAAAFLIRQLAVAMPLALSAALLFEGRLKISRLLKIWVLPAAAMAGYFLWFKYIHGPTWASENYVLLSTLKHISNPSIFISDSLYRVFSVMMETGLLLLPMAAGLFINYFQVKSQKGLRKEAGWIFKSGPWLALTAFGIFTAFNGALPYLENTINRSGFGALTLSGAGFKPSGFFSSDIFWFSMTGLAAVSASLLVCASCFALRFSSPALRFLFFCAAFHLAISLAGAKFFDRYLLTMLPWFTLSAVVAAKKMLPSPASGPKGRSAVKLPGGSAITASGNSKFFTPVVAVTLALAALVSWAGVKDYLSWNGAKWELAARPRAGLKPEEIVNGFDYEAWFTYDKNMAYLKTMKPLKMIDEWEWQKMNNYKAIVSFSQDPRFETIDKIEYTTPLSSKKGVLYLLRFQ